MNYHNITTDDMNNGSGLRTVLWLSGCSHYCNECQNPQTWDSSSGIEFDELAKKELFENLNHEYISGLTLSGGDPLYKHNLYEVRELINEVKEKFPSKTVWLYTGYTWEEITNSNWREGLKTILNVDVVVEGKFEKDKLDVNYHWAGSTNQRVIDVKKSLSQNKVVLFEE